MNDKLKLAAVFLTGIALGLGLSYLVQRYDVLYIGLEGVGYCDHVVKACFAPHW